MNIAIAERDETAAKIEQVLIKGDLATLTPEERIRYYNAVCKSLGLNPLTKPLAYITLSGKLTLYALKDATEQLRKLHGVSITEVTSQKVDDVFVVTAKAVDATGRTDAATGAVPIGNLKGEALANALMKAETKAKRRATLSICGLGILDETEAETIPQPVVVDVAPPADAPMLPEGAVLVRRVESKSRGTAVWGEVTLSTGEVAYARGAQMIALCEQMAQEQAPVVVITEHNGKGKMVLVEIARWRPQPLLPHEPPALEPAAF